MPQDIIIIIIISVDIYIHMYIYIHPITEIHASLFKKKQKQKNIMFFLLLFSPQSNTHIRTLSPGAYIYTIVFCCVCSFFFSVQKKKFQMLTHKSQRFNNSHQCNIQTKQNETKKRKKTSSLRQADAYFICCLITNLYLDVADLLLQLLVVVPGIKTGCCQSG